MQAAYQAVDGGWPLASLALCQLQREDLHRQLAQAVGAVAAEPLLLHAAML